MRVREELYSVPIGANHFVVGIAYTLARVGAGGSIVINIERGRHAITCAAILVTKVILTAPNAAKEVVDIGEGSNNGAWSLVETLVLIIDIVHDVIFAVDYVVSPHALDEPVCHQLEACSLARETILGSVTHPYGWFSLCLFLGKFYSMSNNSSASSISL
jgi:hypothetical protein